MILHYYITEKYFRNFLEMKSELTFDKFCTMIFEEISSTKNFDIPSNEENLQSLFDLFSKDDTLSIDAFKNIIFLSNPKIDLKTLEDILTNACINNNSVIDFKGNYLVFNKIIYLHSEFFHKKVKIPTN